MVILLRDHPAWGAPGIDPHWTRGDKDGVGIDPIKSDTTDRLAMHRGSALKNIRKSKQAG